MSTSWMNSKLSSFPWKPYSAFVVFTPSMKYAFSAPDEPYTVIVFCAGLPGLASLETPGATCAIDE
jgi:hypothetical protein